MLPCYLASKPNKTTRMSTQGEVNSAVQALPEMLKCSQQDLEAFLTQIYRAIAGAAPLKDKVRSCCAGVCVPFVVVVRGREVPEGR